VKTEERAVVDMATGPPDEVEQLLCDDLSELEKAAVVEAVRAAWELLRRRSAAGGVDLRVAGETEITRELRNAVDALRIDPARPVGGFDESKFQHVPESEVTPPHTLSSSEDQIKPDLVFRPVSIGRRLRPGLPSVVYGWYAECKIIDRTKRHGHHKVNEYCAAGLIRFVSLQYAWAMPSGIMIAYVRDGSDVLSCLHRHLAEPENENAYMVVQLPVSEARPPTDPLGASHPVHISVHGRSSDAKPPIPKGKGCLPAGPTNTKPPVRAPEIRISHLWLQAV
jgi:hypothetical protein